MPLGGPPILVGVARPEQVGALGPAWGPLAQSLAAYEGDVLADCGRVTAGAAVTPVLAAADALLFVVRPTMEELYHLRERLGGLAEQLGSRDMHGRRIAVAVVGSDRNRTGASDVQRLLDASGSGATVVGVFVEDAKEPSACATTWPGFLPGRWSCARRASWALACASWPATI